MKKKPVVFDGFRSLGLLPLSKLRAEALISWGLAKLSFKAEAAFEAMCDALRSNGWCWPNEKSGFAAKKERESMIETSLQYIWLSFPNSELSLAFVDVAFFPAWDLRMRLCSRSIILHHRIWHLGYSR